MNLKRLDDQCVVPVVFSDVELTAFPGELGGARANRGSALVVGVEKAFHEQLSVLMQGSR